MQDISTRSDICAVIFGVILPRHDGVLIPLGAPLTVLAPYRDLLAGRLFLCVPAQSSVQAVQRDVTSISLRRIDRACYQDRCDVHSDTSDDTDSPTRRAAKTLSTRATRSRPHSKPVEPSARNRRWRAGHGPGRRSWLENASRGCRVGPRRASGEKDSSG